MCELSFHELPQGFTFSCLPIGLGGMNDAAILMYLAILFGAQARKPSFLFSHKAFRFYFDGCGTQLISK